VRRISSPLPVLNVCCTLCGLSRGLPHFIHLESNRISSASNGHFLKVSIECILPGRHLAKLLVFNGIIWWCTSCADSCPKKMEIWVTTGSFLVCGRVEFLFSDNLSVFLSYGVLTLPPSRANALPGDEIRTQRGSSALPIAHSIWSRVDVLDMWRGCRGKPNHA